MASRELSVGNGRQWPIATHGNFALVCARAIKGKPSPLARFRQFSDGYSSCGRGFNINNREPLVGDQLRIAMRPSVALENNRAAIRSVVARFRAVNPRVFGSVLHGTDQEGSDLDVLVDALPGATFFDLSGLQIELEDLLGVQVHVLTPSALSNKFRARIVTESQLI